MTNSLLRETLLVEKLQSIGQMTIKEMSRSLGVSEATVRRTLSRLEQKGEIIRTYGGAQIASTGHPYSFDRLAKVRTEEKQRIGQVAASIVDQGDTIYLDCGTTIYQMAVALGKRITEDHFTSLNIITNSLANLQVIPYHANCRVILLGGEYNYDRRDFTGTFTEQNLEPFHFTKCFLGCEGASTKMGVTSNSIGTSSLNIKVLDRSDKAYVLMDRSKFGRSMLTRFATFDQLEAIVTDGEPDKAIYGTILGTGCLVHYPTEK